MEKTKLPFGIRAARYTELNKGFLLIAFGYVFCYLFMLDYSVEGMSIFYRWSTTSYSQFQHPALFAVWVLLCSSAVFLNIGYLRGKYGAPQKWLSVLQYAGYSFLILSMLVPTHRAPHITLSHYLYYYVHLLGAMGFALSNIVCILGVFGYKMKTDKRFKYWFWGGIAFVLAVGPLFAVKLCGFIESAPMLFMMAVLYVLNYTKLMDDKKTHRTKEKNLPRVYKNTQP